MTLTKLTAAALVAAAFLQVPASAQKTPLAGPAAPTQAKLQRLLDRDAIGQVIVNYGLAFDMQDWDLHRSVFTDEIEMDFSASIGDGLVKMTACPND